MKTKVVMNTRKIAVPAVVLTVWVEPEAKAAAAAVEVPGDGSRAFNARLPRPLILSSWTSVLQRRLTNAPQKNIAVLGWTRCFVRFFVWITP